MILDALNSYDLAGLLVALAITALVAARLYYGEHIFTAETRWWDPLRRVVLPLTESILESLDPAGETGIDVTYRVGRDELVAILEADYHEILDDLGAAGYQPQPLAALKTDWEGRREVASWARYHGPAPFDAAPDWLRARQTHVTLFADVDDGVPITVITAHEEANPWRPDQWRDHYLGRSLARGVGVVRVAEDLGIDIALDTDVRSERSKRARSFRYR